MNESKTIFKVKPTMICSSWKSHYILFNLSMKPAQFCDTQQWWMKPKTTLVRSKIFAQNGIKRRHSTIRHQRVKTSWTFDYLPKQWVRFDRLTGRSAGNRKKKTKNTHTHTHTLPVFIAFAWTNQTHDSHSICCFGWSEAVITCRSG